MKERGFFLQTKFWGEGAFKPYRTVRHPHELSGIAFDYVVCANKITSAEDLFVFDTLSPVVAPSTTLVSLHNGVDGESSLHKRFEQNQILSAVTYMNCVQPKPGFVRQTSAIRPDAIHLGQCRSTASPQGDWERWAGLVSMDRRFRSVLDIRADRWTKQIFNGAWNPVSAISGLTTHEILESSSPYLHLVTQLATEARDVAFSLAVNVPENVVAETIDFARRNPTISPSMLQDARKQKPMEVESICGTYKIISNTKNISCLLFPIGSICRQADLARVPVPITKAIYSQLLAMNSRYIELS